MIQMEIFGKVEGKQKGAKSLKLNRQHPKKLGAYTYHINLYLHE